MSNYSDESTFALNTVTVKGELEGDGPRASLILYYRGGSKSIALRPGEEVVVGRARPADVPLHDPSLSRRHARFRLHGAQLLVEDLGSTNGTRVNGHKVERATVGERDEVRLGAVIAAFHLLKGNEPLPEGLLSHDTFIERVEQELLRSSTFGRSHAVLLFRAQEATQCQIGQWSPRIASALRPVDIAALYDAQTVEVCLVESDLARAFQLASNILDGQGKRDSQLGCGIACFPQNGRSTDELIETALGLLRKSTAKRPVQRVESLSEQRTPVSGGPVAQSAAMRAVLESARKVADAAIPVLILGETGSGKEVVAQLIHSAGKRRRRPLKCVNCAAIPGQLLESILFGHERGSFTGAVQTAKGVFEEAQGGTVLLDEIGELSPSAQAALLRVIETQTVTRVGGSKELSVDARILAATHRNLETMCTQNLFRWDLYYRLSGMVLKIPPLRERPADVLPLAEHFLLAAAKANGRKQAIHLDEATQALLTRYPFPGNARELKNVIDRAVVIAESNLITVDDLSERIRGAAPAAAAPVADVAVPPSLLPNGMPGGDLNIKDKLAAYEAQLLLEALEQNDWNQTRTAQALGMPLRTLVHKLGVHGLKKRFSQGPTKDR